MLTVEKQTADEEGSRRCTSAWTISIVKPFKAAELLARVRAVLRRAENRRG